MTDEAKAMSDVERVAGELLAALVEAADEIHDLRRHANRTGGMYDEEDPTHLRSIIETSTAAIKAMSGWRDIETAPRDGSKFIGLTKGGQATTMSYRQHINGWKEKEGGGWVPDGRHLVLSEEDSDSICPRSATHWMPLPPPPPSTDK